MVIWGEVRFYSLKLGKYGGNGRSRVGLESEGRF